MPNTPEHITANPELAAELQALQQALAEVEPRGSHDPGDGVLALARLIEGMPLEEWRTLADASGLKNWIAVPLQAEGFPFLKDLQETLDRLQYQTAHDPLTGLANRRAFDSTLELELARSRRGGGKLSLAVFDLDHFKSINDTYGHATGDEVLVSLAKTVLAEKRAYDLAARTGGEEFALILPGTGVYEAQAMLERLLATFSAIGFRGLQHEKPTTFNVTFSAGLTATQGGDKVTPADLMDLADKALYRAKETGRARVEVMRVPSELAKPKPAMVRSDEKKFLFGND